jgi:hypothetical protein
MRTQRGRCIAPWMLVPLIILAVSSECASAPVMVERNLFAQDRKPPTDEPASAAPRKNAPGLSAKAIQLDGVFILGDRKEALIRLKSGVPGKAKGKSQSPYVTVREGERIADYQVTKIEPRSVSLEKDGEAVVVNLFAEGKVAPPAPPVPSTPGTAPERRNPAEAPHGQGAMRMPRPVPPAGQVRAEQPVGQDPGSMQPEPEGEHAADEDLNAPDDEGVLEDEEPIDEEDMSE